MAARVLELSQWIPSYDCNVQVIMQAHQEWLSNLSGCRDKFLVQTCTLPADLPEASAAAFMASCTPVDAKHTKLRVVLLETGVAQALGAPAPHICTAACCSLQHQLDYQPGYPM